MRSSRLLVIIILVIFMVSAMGRSADYGVQTIDGSGTAWGVTADGVTVVGVNGNNYDAFRWTKATGMYYLDETTWPDTITSIQAFDVSGNGSTIVGRATTDLAGEAYRWTDSEGLVGLGFLPGGPGTFSTAYAITPDGSVIVGGSDVVGGYEAFRWTQAEGMVSLGELPGGDHFAFAEDVSDDGLVVVGRGKSQFGFDKQAFRWTQSEGMVGLGYLPGGGDDSSAAAVSADGSVVVGTSTSAASGAGQGEAFRWTEADGMVGLGDLEGGWFFSRVNDVSADGSIVVGSSRTDEGLEAFIWDKDNGMRKLSDVLAQLLGVPSVSRLGMANAISGDGTVIVGATDTGAASYKAWVVVIPEPTTLALLAIGGLALIRRRK